MKNFLPLFIALSSTFTWSCYAQQNDRILNNGNMESPQLVSAENELAVISYHVEERINMPLGGGITTYNVPSLDLVNTNDLGQSNSRTITPKYAKAKPVVTAVEATPTPVKQAKVIAELPMVVIATPVVTAVKPIEAKTAIPKDVDKLAYINIINTYERVLENGYVSVDMLKKVADARFFSDNLIIAAKWYTALFNLTTDLDAVYYYRYAQSLKATGEIEKATEMMKLFEAKN